MPLHLASDRGSPTIVGLLLKYGADVDAQENNAMTPLLLVLPRLLSGDGCKATQQLLEHGASARVRNKNGQTPLHIASHHELFSIVALLLKSGADVDAQDNAARTPLHWALQSLSGDGSKTAQLLLEHGASVNMRNKNGQMPLHLASDRAFPTIVGLLLKYSANVDAQDNDAMTPLHLVSESHSGDGSKTAQLLLEHGASVHVRDRNGQMPLHLASHCDIPTIVGVLLKYGADVDAQDNATMTPLHWVSNPFSGDGSKTAQLLLEHGASVHVRDRNGQMPLHLASHHKLFSTVALLLKFGADVHAQDNDVMTPLLLALQDPYNTLGNDSSITKITQLLLEHGAIIHVRNKNGRMPLHLASQHSLSGVVKLLLEFGAEVDAWDNGNITPLHFAVSSPLRAFRREQYDSESDLSVRTIPDSSPTLRNTVETIKLLLRHGANLQMQNDEGETPLQVALRRGEQEIMWEMDNRALGASSTTIGLPFFLSSLTYVKSDTSVRDARLLFHAGKLSCD